MSAEGAKGRSTNPKISFTWVAAQVPMISMSMENLEERRERAADIISVEGRRARIVPPAEIVKETAKKTVTYRCVGVKSRRLEPMTNAQTERAFRAV